MYHGIHSVFVYATGLMYHGIHSVFVYATGLMYHGIYSVPVIVKQNSFCIAAQTATE